MIFGVDKRALTGVVHWPGKSVKDFKKKRRKKDLTPISLITVYHYYYCDFHWFKVVWVE
jgi:hypothetical protein